MVHSETYSGLYEFFEGDLYATVELKDSGDGWVSEWWVSRNLRKDLGVQLLGYFRIPVFGEMKEDAKLRLGFIYEDVVNFARDIAGGFGSVGAGSDVASARKHAKAHLQVWSDVIGGTKTMRTAVLYSLAVDFGVNNPASLIAEVEVIGVRTIHERVAYARRIGILDSYGQGRIQRSVESSDVEEEPEFTGGVVDMVDPEAEGFAGRFKVRGQDGVWRQY